MGGIKHNINIESNNNVRMSNSNNMNYKYELEATSSNSDITTLLENIGSNYSAEKNKAFKGNTFAKKLRQEGKSIFSNIIKDENYLTHVSVGQGQWSEIPWIGIYDSQVTTSAQNGYYLVYTFNTSMNKVYFSLMLGFTEFDNLYKGAEKYKKTTEMASHLSSLLSDYLPAYNVEKIDLNSKKKLAKGYESAHICGLEYELHNMKPEYILRQDLKRMIQIYELLKSQISMTNGEFVNIDRIIELNNSSIDIVEDIDFIQIVQETPVLEIVDRKVEAKKAVVVRTGTVARSNQVKSNVLAASSYKCEIDNDHETFLIKDESFNYVEAHHLIPLKYQNDFKYSLDVESNVVSLCPNCHRMLHHGTVDNIKSRIKVLYDERKDRLAECGIGVSLKALYTYYNLDC